MNDEYLDNQLFNFEVYSEEEAQEHKESFNFDEFLELKFSDNFNKIYEPEHEQLFDLVRYESVKSKSQREEKKELKKKKKIVKAQKKEKAKSEITKNVCFNIIQKTIKMIKDGLYDEKISEICMENEIEVEEFVNEIIASKKEFTGPKALALFLNRNDAISNTFSAFMKWFLEEKYLRFAINYGEMKNLAEYIDFKNKVILPMLQ